MKRLLVMAVIVSAVSAFAAEPQTMASFEEVPVGIAASKDGRVFIAFSRAIDPHVTLSVAEVKDGKHTPYPAGFKQDDGMPTADRLLSVQALTVDAKNRLWILDTAKVGTNAVQPGTPKLVAIDLATNKVWKKINFPEAIAGKTSFLNDLRVDLSRGKAGVIYITDASPEGPNGIVVVDIANGVATRKLNDDPSTKPDPALTLKVENQPLIQKRGPKMGEPFRVGADGIALSGDGKWLYYSPLTSHKLYRVSTDALAKSDEEAKKSIEDLGDKGFASDGMEADAQNRVYATDFEGGTVRRLDADGKWETVATGADLSWPDTFAIMSDGSLLVTATQIHRSPRFRPGDQRQTPFKVLKVATDSKPVMIDAAKAKGRSAPPVR